MLIDRWTFKIKNRTVRIEHTWRSPVIELSASVNRIDRIWYGEFSCPLATLFVSIKPKAKPS